LLGDFAFVIWDERKEHLFCARDFIGVRPFYYYIDDEKFIFGSDLKALSQHPDISLDIRDESVADYLVNGQLLDRKHTFFQKIYKLEDGCHMTITPIKQTTTRYWHPKKVRKEKLPNEQAYINKLRELLEDAVKVRMRTAYPVASHLSGGLDSSPIAVLVAREMKKRDPNYQLPVYTWHKTPTTHNKEHFEWKRLELVSKQENNIEIIYSDLSTKQVISTVTNTNILTNGGHLYIYEPQIRQHASSQNIRTIFSGWGGDEFISNHGYAYFSELFIRGKWKQLYTEIQYWNRNKDKTIKNHLGFLYKKIFIPLLPSGLYCHLPYIECQDDDLSMIKKDFLPIIHAALKKKNHVFSRYTAKTILEDILRAYTNGHVQARLEVWSQESKNTHLDYVFPLLDRRVVDFTFAIPIEYTRKYNIDRYLYKKAIEDLIPSFLINGQYKNEPKLWDTSKEILNKANEELLEDYKEDIKNNKFIKVNEIKSDKKKYFHILSLLLRLR
jgi:asparagine synthase (glutamine-hydrolysing)